MVLYFPDNCTTHCFALLGHKGIYPYTAVGALYAGEEVSGGRGPGSNNLIRKLNGAEEIFLHRLAAATRTETQKLCDSLPK